MAQPENNNEVDLAIPVENPEGEPALLMVEAGKDGDVEVVFVDPDPDLPERTGYKPQSE